MLPRRQLSLLLDGQDEAEGEALWRGLPLCSRREVTLLYARQIRRAAKGAPSPPHRETDDEHTDTEASDEHHQ